MDQWSQRKADTERVTRSGGKCCSWLHSKYTGWKKDNGTYERQCWSIRNKQTQSDTKLRLQRENKSDLNPSVEHHGSFQRCLNRTNIFFSWVYGYLHKHKHTKTGLHQHRGRRGSDFPMFGYSKSALMQICFVSNFRMTQPSFLRCRLAQIIRPEADCGCFCLQGDVVRLFHNKLCADFISVGCSRTDSSFASGLPFIMVVWQRWCSTNVPSWFVAPVLKACYFQV